MRSILRHRRRGSWIGFEDSDPGAKTVTISTSCISTSSEMAGHYQSVLTGGNIVGVSDRVTASPQNFQDGSSRD